MGKVVPSINSSCMRLANFLQPGCFGSPACAAMDPGPSCCVQVRTRFPRMRGDGPTQNQISAWTQSARPPPPVLCQNSALLK